MMSAAVVIGTLRVKTHPQWRVIQGDSPPTPGGRSVGVTPAVVRSEI